MITIALDEGGRFEQLENNAKCMYVGGVVFQYKDKKACKAELERLQKFLKETCEKEGCKYPEDLHYNRENGIVKNGESAKKVKTTIIHYLPDFLNGKGEWQSDGPNGKYYFYALVGDRNGVESFTKSGISNLINDEIGCNRYEHMAYRSIENLLFFNPRLPDNLVRLDLATRVVVTDGENGDFEKEIKTTGHEKSKEELNESVYKVTSAASFRAAIATMIQNSNKKDIQFDDVRVESIYYHSNPTHNFYQGFLYLSDIVCSLYGDILNGCNKVDIAIEKLWLECQQFVSNNRFLCWSYNDFDQDYRLVYKSYDENNYFTMLKEIYRLTTKESEKNAFVYDTLWFSELKKNVLFKAELNSLAKAIEKLDLVLGNSDIPVSEARFIFDFLKPKTEELCEKDHRHDILFHLYQAELTINNHEGNYQEAKKVFEKCKIYSQHVNVEEYLELRNKYSVCLCDAREFDLAIEFTKETLEWEKMLIEVKQAVFPEKNNINIHYGRTLSQLGQCYSFKGEYQLAEECFISAIEAYGQASSEIARTRSYLLHSYIESGNFIEYEKNAKLYFRSENLKEQLIILLDNIGEDVNAYSFSLYVYLKGFYFFYAQSMDKKILKDIIGKLDFLKNFDKNNNHPFEMIYKYVALLCVIIGNKEYDEKAQKYIDLAKTTLSNPEGILLSILSEIDTQYESVISGGKLIDNSKLTYMYR